MDELTPDLGLARWVRDFALLGGGVGTMGPAAVLVPLAVQQSGLVQVEVWSFIVPAGIGGALLGVVLGGLLHTVTRAAIEHPLWLAPIGFPAGFVCGGLVGAGLAQQAPASATGVGLVMGLLGGVTGGLVLGLAWRPYLACKVRGRSGLPVVAASVVVAALVGPLVMASLMFGLGTGP